MGQASSRGQALGILAQAASSKGQALNVIARIATDTPWDTIDVVRLQQIVDLPQGVLGEKFAEFLQKHAVPRKLIAHIDIVKAPAVKGFAPGAWFYRHLGHQAKVLIGDMGLVFGEVFLASGIPEERDTPETPVGVYELLYAMRGTRVVEALQAQERRRSKLSTVWFFLEKQGRGQEGSLSLEEPNVFFVNDINGLGRAVSIYWNRVAGWWEVGLNTMKNAERWGKGTRFFCPDLGL